MKILHRYVLKEHFGPLIFALTALTSLLLLQYIAKRFGELVGKGLPWSVIAEFLTLSIPLTLALSLPMAVLVSTLYAFSRLASENEITAMKASGVSLRNVLTPVLIAALGVTFMMVGFNDQVLPRANHRLRTLQGDIAQKKPTFGLREQVINEVSPGKLYLRAGHISPRSNVMREVTIYDLGDPTRRRTIYADSGNMAMTPNQADLELTLYSGTVHEVPTAAPHQLQRLYFDAQLVRVRGVGNEFRKTTNDTFKGEREMSVCEMERNAKSAYRSLALAKKEFREAVQMARARGVKLSQDALKTETSAPFSIALGSAYCQLLAQIGVKQLGAQQPDSLPPRRVEQAAPVRPPQADSARPQQAEPAPAEQAAPTVTVKRPQLDQIRQRAGRAGAAQAAPPVNPAIAAPAIPEPVPTAAIPSQVESARLRVMDSLHSINLYEVEIQKKFALAAACFVFVLLGAPIALRFPRGGVGLTIGVSLVVFALYYVGLIAGEALARRGMIPPVLSMWGANIVFTAIALTLLSRMGRESGSNRGGDLRELLGTAKSRFRRGSRRPPASAAVPGATAR